LEHVFKGEKNGGFHKGGFQEKKRSKVVDVRVY
jgi:hypothetical protein